MSGCNRNQNYFIQNNRTTSRVLAPPGGQSSFSIGGGDEVLTRNQGRRQVQQQAEYDPCQARRPPPPAVGHVSSHRHEEEDYSCNIPGLQDHYRNLAKKNGAPSSNTRLPRDRVEERDSRPPRESDMEREAINKDNRPPRREAAKSFKAQVRFSEEESIRHRDPSPHDRESGCLARSNRTGPVVDAGPSTGEIAMREIMDAKKRSLERNTKRLSVASTGGQSRRGSSEKKIIIAEPTAISRRSAPTRDAYENVLSSGPAKPRGPREREQRSTNDASKKDRRDVSTKLVGGMDRRGPAVPPGGNSCLSLGWD